MGRLTREKWSERDVAFSEEIRSQLYEIYNKAEIDESKTDLYKMLNLLFFVKPTSINS